MAGLAAAMHENNRRVFGVAANVRG